MNAEIRSFEIADYPAALRLWKATEGVGLSESDSLQGITQFLTRNPGLSLVAVAGDQLVATILCGHDGRRGLIHHLVVHPSHRGHGLGKQLVRLALAKLHDQDINKCHLLVYRDNPAGRVFWHRIGGEERTSLTIFSFSTHECGQPSSERINGGAE
jgi:ribosomal protein S18 acetylase RimI-like enzyme